MRVAVTGAAGHLGGAVVRALLADGHHVRALVHTDRRALVGLDVEAIAGDVRDPDAVGRLVAGCERVYHLAAMISLDARDAAAMHAVNVEGTRTVLAAARGLRVVHASSIHAFAGDAPVTERSPPTRAKAPYDRSKAAADALCGPDVAIIYPTAIVGPYDFKPSPFGQVLLDLARRRLPGLVAGGFDWVDVRDVARAAIAAGERGGRYLITGHRAALVDVADLVAAQTGARRPRFVTPMWLARLAAPFAVAWARLRGRRPLFTPFSLAALRHHREIDGSRAKLDLGHAPRPLAETVRDALAWFRAEGQL